MLKCLLQVRLSVRVVLRADCLSYGAPVLGREHLEARDQFTVLLEAGLDGALFGIVEQFIVGISAKQNVFD